MSNEPTTTETITYPKPTPQTPPALVKKIGKLPGVGAFQHHQYRDNGG